MLFQKQDLYIWMKKKKTDMATSNNPDGDSHKKIILKRGEAWLKPGDFTYSYLRPFAQE